ncbi:MAG: AMP-binding protein, partial [Acidimicrobiia bacterium]|nr:AMP-binding protein [Acidimicrobiia bacterium]
MATPEPGSIDGWIGRWATTDRQAFVFEGATVGYRHLWDRIGSVARGLSELGAGAGDRVAYCGLNRLELFETLFACARIGAIFCPLNNRLTPPELAFQLSDSQPSALLTCDGFDAALAEAAAAAGTTAPLRDLDIEPFADDATRATGPGLLLDDPARLPATNEPVLMVYTSGTTGRPRGAVLTQRSLLYTCLNSIDHQQLTGDDCIIAPLPT